MEKRYARCKEKRLGLVASAARGECFKKVNVSSVNTVTFNGFAGIIVVKQVGDHPDFDEVYHLPGVPSLLSYGEVCQRNREKEAAGDKKHRLSLNKDGEIVWRCHDRDFVLANNGSNLHMYTCDSAKNCKSSKQKWGSRQSAYIETVAHHERLYSKMEVKAAQAVRAYSMGGLSMANLMEAARSRRAQGLDFNAHDIMRAFRIYGPSRSLSRDV